MAGLGVSAAESSVEDLAPVEDGDGPVVEGGAGGWGQGWVPALMSARRAAENEEGTGVGGAAKNKGRALGTKWTNL